MDKNEIRYMKETDTKESKKWYQNLIDSIKEDIESLLELVRAK